MKKNASTIRNVIFDLGDVLFRWTHSEIAKKLQAEGLSLPLHFTKITSMHAWREFDRGTISVEDLPSSLAEHFPPELVKSFLKISIDHMELIPEGAEAVKKCKEEGYNLFILSNMSQYYRDRLLQKFSIFEYFNGSIFSCDVNYIKPEPSIYERLLKQYNLNPRECFFIDDRDENIQAAGELHISGKVCDWKDHHFDLSHLA